MKTTMKMVLALFPVVAMAGGIAPGKENPALTAMRPAKALPAPEAVEAASFTAWLGQYSAAIGADEAVSAFTESVFAWYENEKGRDLPAQAYHNRDHIHVDVNTAKAKTLELERAGDIEELTTVGADIYAEMDGAPEQVLETMLFRWGKPVSMKEGKTYPAPSPFGKRVEYYAPMAELGPNAFVNMTMRHNGGIVQNLEDRYLMLIYPASQGGWDLVMQYVRPAGKTATTRSLAIAMIRPGKGGKTAFKMAMRYQGQNYGALGGLIGRSQFGFNEGKVRDGQLGFHKMLQQLREKGAIEEFPSGIGPAAIEEEELTFIP
ncbi:MAG: hypothetical protein HUU37_00710 [Bdellovibrionales bacterium]|nr:hypothetical protein [Bdellovibrionales bacterium]